MDRTMIVHRLLENDLGREHRAIDLEHLLFENEMPSPERDQIVLQRTTHGTVIVQTIDTTVNSEGLIVEKPSFQQILQLGTVYTHCYRGKMNRCFRWPRGFIERFTLRIASEDDEKRTAELRNYRTITYDAIVLRRNQWDFPILKLACVCDCHQTR